MIGISLTLTDYLRLMPAPYTTYGFGRRLLFAFHGYGMDGRQFQVLEASLCQDYQIVGFHLPYHKDGPMEDEGWLLEVKVTIEELLESYEVDELSFAGYSIGCKVVLSLLPDFRGRVRAVHLFAPYGLTRNPYLWLLESRFGKWLFRSLVKSNWPGRIISGAYQMKLIADEDHQILQSELDAPEKRRNLCETMRMMSELSPDIRQIAEIFDQVARSEEHPGVRLVFGKHDPIFARKKLTSEVANCASVEVLEVDAGHWMMTKDLDEWLEKEVKVNVDFDRLNLTFGS